MGWGSGRVDPDAGRPEPLECRQGSLVGAAADRAGVRGEVRSYGGRPLPPPARILALAARQAAPRLPLRPARSHTRLRVGEGVRGLSFSGTCCKLMRIRYQADERPRI